ncbi:MAG: hypothetical protein ACYCPQ_00675 [Elusimicrobiota bacterium]
MKGRKPKYPQDVINEIAARLAAGESASALSHEMGLPRTSVLRCADSTRIPPERREENMGVARETKLIHREKLYWRAFEALLRQFIRLAPKATEKGVAVMAEALAKMKPALATSGLMQRKPKLLTSEETLMIFRSRFQQPAAQSAQVEPDEESPAGDLDGPIEGAADVVADGGGPGDSAAPDGGNSAT